MVDGRDPGAEPGREQDEPIFDEPTFDEPTFDEPAFQEPAFSEPVFDEPVFQPPSDAPTAPPDEPVFQEPAPLPAGELEAAPPSSPAAGPAASPGDDEYAPFGQEPGRAASQGRRRRLGQTGPIWLILGGVILVVLVAFLLQRGEEPPAAASEPTVAAPQETTAPVAEPAQPSPTPAPPPPTPVPLLQPGQRVVVGNTDGEGIRLRNAPGLDSLTLEIYLDGRAFLVLEPGSEFTAYPVEKDGYRWYRVQVADDPADQLVGWVAGDFLLPAP